MFSVIISEKGGAERRESFDRTEINVGRVQGNDLMLPKGNVSKRHARLLYRDGRFIVTDLKSTNGTYVNGRKIAQATIVREGDKIYIGDFVLRIETSQAPGASPTGGPPPLGVDEAPPADAAPPSSPIVAAGSTSAQMPVANFLANEPTRGQVAYAPPAMPYEAAPTPAKGPLPYEPGAPAKPAAGPPHASSGPPPAGDMPSSQPFSSSSDMGLRPGPRIEPKPSDASQVISHFPLEHDPDDSVHYQVPGPPRVPTAGRPQPKPSPTPGARPATGPLPGSPTPTPAVPPYPPAGSSVPPVERATAPSAGMVPSGPGTSSDVGRSSAPAATTAASAGATPAGGLGRLAMPPARPETQEPIEPSRIGAHRAAIVMLLERVSEAIDLRALENGALPDEAMAAHIDRTLGARMAALRAQGEIRAEVDADAVVIEARRELLEYGPLTPLLDDEDVSELQVVRHDYVLAMHGRRQVPSDIGFSSERSLGRAIRRLCVASGRPLAQSEMFVERRLGRSVRMFAVLPTTPEQGHMLVIRKPQRADLTLEDLVRSGTISRAMAGLLGQCVEARANILVTGAVGTGATSLLGALAGAGNTTDRVVVLQEEDELILNQPHAVSILLGDTPAEGARAVRAAAQVRPERLVVGAFAGRVAAEVIDAMGDGVSGVLAAARASTLRQAAVRLTADLASTKAGLAPDIAREWLASAFDLVLEIARLRDGRHRVLRIAEFHVEGSRIAIRDIFTFAVERTAAGGALEGSFHATGVVPAIVDELGSRGVTIDTSIFKRHTSGRPG